MKSKPDVPEIFTGLLVHRPEPAALAAKDHRSVMERRGAPDAGVDSLVFLDRPNNGVITLTGGIELDQLPELTSPRVAALKFGRHIQGALFIDNDRGVDVVADPKAEVPNRVITSSQRCEIPSLNEPSRVGEIHRVATDGNRVLDRDVVIWKRREQFGVPARS